MNKQEFLRLLDKFMEGKATGQEMQLLKNYYNSFQQTTDWNELELGSSREAGSLMLDRLTAVIGEEKTKPLPFYATMRFRIAAAAVIVLIAGSAVLFTLDKKEAVLVKKDSINTNKGDFFPEGNSATLTLASGNKIELDSMLGGVVVSSGNSSIRKNGDILICEYAVHPGLTNGEISYNTISVSKGGQYQIVLPDKTMVWLNTASSLSFPSSFTGNERKVNITGEAYFEVAKDKTKPFRVYITGSKGNVKEGAVIEVLGTHFNINAYDDESMMKTTLLEGSVKITPDNKSSSASGDSRVLNPGEQAIFSSRNFGKTAIQVQAANIEEVMAWKHSLFNFNTADIKTIMREIARWYNVEIVYEGEIPVRIFSGKINRRTPLSNVLKILEQSNIHLRIEDNKVIVRS